MPRTQSRIAATVGVGALILVPLVVLAVGAWQYRWMSDDGFINLRIISEIKAGHGPVFNAGERVEASTSPLWILVLLVGDLVLPFRLEWVAVLLGIALTLVGIGLAVFGATRLAPRAVEPRIWLPAGALVLAVLAPMWKFASGGLENGLTFAWLGACLAILATWAWADTRLRVGSAVVLGLGPLVRPELALFSLAFLAVVVAGQWRRDRWSTRGATLGSALALPVAYEIFRMGFYASLVPNSALAKEASRPYWSAGWAYLRETVAPYELWIPVLVLVAAAYVPLLVLLRRAGRTRGILVVAAFVAGALLDGAYIVRVGGDFMPARLLLPALFAFTAPVAVVPLQRAFAGALLVVPWACIALFALRSDADQPRAFGPDSLYAVTTDDFGLAPGGANRSWFDGHGVYFLYRRLPARPSAHDPAVANYGIGVTAYALGPDTYLLDLLGLGDAFTSHLQLHRRGTIAHEKPLPIPWIPARLVAAGSELTPDDFTLPTFFLARPLDHPGGQAFDARIADARTALRCSRLREFAATYSGPLDAGRFLSNLGDAFANYRFRIPPEPRDAVTRFCRR